MILTPRDSRIFETAVAPSNFSFVDNTEEVLFYFKQVSDLLANRNQVKFDLKEINNLTPDAIALLIAKVKDDQYTRGLRVEGNKPEKRDLKRIFEESGFLEHVNSYYTPPKNENHLLIHQLTHKKVEPEADFQPFSARGIGARDNPGESNPQNA